MIAPASFDSFIGLPFRDHGRDRAGVDCWGLVRLAYAEGLGIALPSYTEAYATVGEHLEIAAALATHSARRPWRRVGIARPWDVVMFRRGTAALHVGLVTAPGDMLHVARGLASRLERYDCGAWAPRLIGIHRHEGLQ